MDIDYVLKCLSEIREGDLFATSHLETRVFQRRNKFFSDVNSIRSIILNNKPVSIIKENDIKFKLLYELDNDNDLAIVLSSRTINPITFNLVTCYMKPSSERKR